MVDQREGAAKAYEFHWDGLDVYGRRVQGAQVIKVKREYKWAIYYQLFSYNNNQINVNAPSIKVRIAQGTRANTWTGTIGLLTNMPEDLGGWSLTSHHAYDPVAGMLYMGNGNRRRLGSIANRLLTFVSSGIGISNIATFPDGSAVVSTFNAASFDALNRIYKIGTDGTSVLLAGGGAMKSDNIPATQALLEHPTALVVARDGSVYFNDGSTVRRVAPNGILTTIAGGGNSVAEGIPATQALLATASGLALGPDQSIYVATTADDKVYRISPDGIIATFAGSGPSLYVGGKCVPSGDGGLAVAAKLCAGSSGAKPQHNEYQLAAAADGTVYVSSNIPVFDPTTAKNIFWGAVRAVSPQGTISTVAGMVPSLPPLCSVNSDCAVGQVCAGASCLQACTKNADCTSGLCSGGHCPAPPFIPPVLPLTDGGAALGAGITILGLGVAQNGGIWLSVTPVYNSEPKTLWKIAPSGTMTQWAGGGTSFSNKIPALNAFLGVGQGFSLPVAHAPNGNILIGSSGHLSAVSDPFPGYSNNSNFIPSEDGSELYQFSPQGRHLATVHPITGTTLFQFTYDTAGHLASMNDAYGNTTTILRNPAGTPTGIQGPYGQVTSLTTDANGYLASITRSPNEQSLFGYGPDGLLTSMVDSRGYQHLFAYDAKGYLSSDTKADGGSVQLERIDVANGKSVTFTSASGLQSTYLRQWNPNKLHSVNTMPTGGTNTVDQGGDAKTTFASPTGEGGSWAFGPDPRWAMLAPVRTSLTVTEPGLPSLSVTRSSSVVLQNPLNLLSVVSVTNQETRNGKLYQSLYSAATKTWTTKTPLNRSTTRVIDTKGTTVSYQEPATNAVALAYDNHGRLVQATQGARTTTYVYASRLIDGVVSQERDGHRRGGVSALV